MIEIILAIVVLVLLVKLAIFLFKVALKVLHLLWKNIGKVIALSMFGGGIWYCFKEDHPFSFLQSFFGSVTELIWSFMYQNTILNGIWIYALIIFSMMLISTLIMKMAKGEKGRTVIATIFSLLAATIAFVSMSEDFNTKKLLVEVIIAYIIMRVFQYNVKKRLAHVTGCDEAILEKQEMVLQIAMITIISTSKIVIGFANSFFDTNISYIRVPEIIIFIMILVMIRGYRDIFKGYRMLKTYIKNTPLFEYSILKESNSFECLKNIENPEEYIEAVIKYLTETKRIFLMPVGKRLFMNRRLYEYLNKKITENETSEAINKGKEVEIEPGLFSEIYKYMFSMRKGFTLDFTEKDELKAKKEVQGIVSTGEFSILRYSTKNHPVLSESEKVKESYIVILDYLVKDSGIKSGAWDAKLTEYCSVFGVAQQNIGEGQSLKEELVKEICCKKQYHLLVLFEAMYFRKLLGDTTISYQLIESLFKLLKIEGTHRDLIYRYIKSMYLAKASEEAASLLDNIGKSNCVNMLEYVSSNITCDDTYIQMPQYQVAVCATMSAGKSTFINALLGRNIIPAKNEACTAKVTTIRNNTNLDRMIGYNVRNNDSKIFSNQINACVLETWNEDTDVKSTNLESSMDQISGNHGTLVVHDTPGTNNSADITHHDKTIEFLEVNNMDLIVYLINAEYISTTDTEILLKEIQEIHKGRKTQIVFALNKIDCFDEEEEDSLYEIMQRLREQLEGYGFAKPSIFPMSANASRLFKLVLNGHELSKREKRTFRNMLEYFSSTNAMDAILNIDTTQLKQGLDTKLLKNDHKIIIDEEEYSYTHIMNALNNTGVPVLERWLELRMAGS